jgi:segregation and condensation protein B
MEIVEKTLDEIDSEADEENRRKVEAALFIAGKFLSLKELIVLTDVNLILLKRILEDLKDKYSTYGLQIVQKGDLWKMDVAEEYVGMVNKLATGSSEFSKAEQETLAIIAYKQPIKQSVIIKIRGNKAYDHVKTFVEQGLIIKKRMGHTAELSLSDNFHDYFALETSRRKPENSTSFFGEVEDLTVKDGDLESEGFVKNGGE